nr:uncharacterized protein LOC111425114 [Onthophagus taurus]
MVSAHTMNNNNEYVLLPTALLWLPQQKIDKERLQIPEKLQLADPDFHKPNSVDILLGASVFFELLSIGQIKLNGNEGPILQKTKLGWIIAGNIPFSLNCNSCFLITRKTINENTALLKSLERCWEIEESPKVNHLSPEDLEVETHFRNTYQRGTDGRFQVSLPLKDNPQILGESYDIAKRRLISLENKFAKNSELKEEYTKFMSDYESLGHMSEVGADELGKSDTSNEVVNYVPHHCVLKMSSTTTKLRVVFDASAKTSSGFSLNDLLRVGPVVQDDLISIILRFRLYNYVLTGDIAKMYRQVNIHPEQRNLQRILWRDNSNNTIKHFTLNTVTYGTATASYLSTRCLYQLARDNEIAYPDAARSIDHDFYMDDLLTGANTEQRVLQLKQEISGILSQGKFELRKFNSNSHKVNNNTELKDLNLIEAKILGIAWDSVKDEFRISVNISTENRRFTKRFMLSTISQIFDPLGLVGPVILRGKILLQKMWLQKIDWDETVPQDIYLQARDFLNDLKQLDSITISRHVALINSELYQICGFCDASQSAYGACVYIKTLNEQGNISSRLLMAKSKVAPVKVITIPRLELAAALLLARLVASVREALDVPIDGTWYFSDSKIVLAWICSTPNTLKTFVANRLSEIQNLTNKDEWLHISSRDNPADLISRGTDSKGIKESSSWWHGPHWLEMPVESWPAMKSELTEEIPELKTTNLVMTRNTDAAPIFDRYSSWSKLQKSKRLLVKLAQEQEFSEDISNLKAKGIKLTSKLKTLDPFLDEDGILRVGGRLANTDLTFSRKHQIILPSKHKLTELIIRHKHLENLHAGVQTLLSIIRLEYWPVNGKNVIKKILRSCTICFRVKPRFIFPKMGMLPKERTTPVRPFTNVGVDYAGPILIKDGKLRNRRFIKSYVCLFVTDLTSDTFLNAFKRFVGRRGLCRCLYSDNATNFKGAKNLMYANLEDLAKDPDISNYFRDKGVIWHFIPARSPHFGGIWEAAVKRVKYHLMRTIGDERLTYETFSTVLIQIESIVNSRPLLPLCSDPQDLELLTPGHFLIGTALLAVPEVDVSEIPVNRLTNYKQLQKLHQSFWKRWSLEYLHTLQQRTKWRFDREDLVKVGSMVLLKDDNLPPRQWRTGRIEELHPGPDGRVRVVKIHTSGGTVSRSVHRVCVLPIEEQ